LTSWKLDKLFLASPIYSIFVLIFSNSARTSTPYFEI